MNELFEQCLAEVNPETRAEVRKNMDIDTFIHTAVLIVENKGLSALEDELYAILAKKGGFSVDELKEKSSLSLDFDGKEQRIRMARKFAMQPIPQDQIKAVFGDVEKIEVDPYSNKRNKK